MSLYRKLGIAFVFSWFFFGGLGHFVAADFFTSIVPPYIPYPRAVVYISGVFELLGAFGILIPGLRRLAGACLVLLVFCVTPANVHMSLHPEQFAQLFPEMLRPYESLILALRLVIQVGLVATIIGSTVLPEKRRPALA